MLVSSEAVPAILTPILAYRMVLSTVLSFLYTLFRMELGGQANQSGYSGLSMLFRCNHRNLMGQLLRGGTSFCILA